MSLRRTLDFTDLDHCTRKDTEMSPVGRVEPTFNDDAMPIERRTCGETGHPSCSHIASLASREIEALRDA
jgi:hypothetical protein